MRFTSTIYTTVAFVDANFNLTSDQANRIKDLRNKLSELVETQI